MIKEKKSGKARRVYNKPVFIKERELTFPEEIIKEFNGGKYCLQCSSCHGCR